MFRLANSLHVGLYRRSGGKFAGQIANMPVLLITTYGRVTTRPTTNAVVYIQQGQDFIVSATNGGATWDPGWYRNLKAHPEARIEVGHSTYEVCPVFTDGEERQRLYDQFIAASPNFVKYEQKASRVIPVIRLTPAHQKEIKA